MKYLYFFLCLSLFGVSTTAQIVINEINYKDVIGFESKDWIELYNNSTNTVDISNWVFKDEDDLHEFILPSGTIMTAGSYLVLVQFLADFQTVHPSATPVLGDFTFGLSGGGELIRLFDNNAVLIDYVEYDDVAPWPIEPDGNGPTLELINPNLDNTLASSWSGSIPPNGTHGTPGVQNSTYIVVGIEDFEINEFTVYPNPIINEATISITGTYDSVKIVVYDLLGREVKKLESDSNRIILEKGNLKPGVYILELHANNNSESHTQKIIIN